MLIIRKWRKNSPEFICILFDNSSYMSPQGYPPYGGGYPDEHYGGNRNRTGGYNPPVYSPGGPITTTQVTIPTEMAGK